MSYNSDEDVTEASIYDMDHAPQLPQSSLASQSSAWTGMHQSSATNRRESLSPRPLPRNRRSLSSMSLGDSIRSSLHLKSDSASSSRRHLYGMQSSPAPGSYAATDPNPSIPAPRQRAQSTPVTRDPFAIVADHPIPNAQSFPPPIRASSDSLDRRVAFAAGGSFTTRDPLSRRRLDNDTELTDMKEDVERGESTDMDLVAAAGSSRTPNADGRLRTETSQSGPSSPSHDWMDFDEDGEAADSESVVTTSPQRMKFLGWELPMWCTKRRISWTRKLKQTMCLHCKFEQPLRTSISQFASLNCMPIRQASPPLSWRRRPAFCACS
jgi:hypothetical protein